MNKAGSSNAPVTARRWQFTLESLLGSIVCVALALGLLTNRHTGHQISVRCSQLPENDERLWAWFRAQPGVADLTISRRGKTVFVRYSNRGAVQSAILNPPWEEFGYGLSGGRSISSRESLWNKSASIILNVPLVLWAVVLLMAAALPLLTRLRKRSLGRRARLSLLAVIVLSMFRLFVRFHFGV